MKFVLKIVLGVFVIAGFVVLCLVVKELGSFLDDVSPYEWRD